MKIKNIKYILSVLITIFALTSCDKEELNVAESQTALKQSILTFSTQEEFTNTMDKVNAMSKVQRLNWEKEQGFKSFGTICDEFYETINPEQFKSIEEVKSFVAKNADKIELYTSSDGETYCVTKDFRNTKRYLINRDKEYKIGVTTYKEEGDNQAEKYSVTNSLGLQKANAAIVTSDEIIDENKIGSDTYRMHIWINTYNYYDTSVYVTFLKNELKLSNFARWLAIWWERTYSTEYRITLKRQCVNTFLRKNLSFLPHSNSLYQPILLHELGEEYPVCFPLLIPQYQTLMRHYTLYCVLSLS